MGSTFAPLRPLRSVRLRAWLTLALVTQEALFLAPLKRQEQLAGPGFEGFVVGDGRDADARVAEPEVCEDALAAAPARWKPFHSPAPCLGSGSRRPLGAESGTRSQGWRGERQARPEDGRGP